MRAQDRLGTSRWANKAELELMSSFFDCKISSLLIALQRNDENNNERVRLHGEKLSLVEMS